MTEAWNFDAALARVPKSQWEIKLLVENAYGDKKKSQVNSLFKAVKDEKITKMTKSRGCRRCRRL
jgi:hypothetical protein